jgi:hypothetical protein
MTSLVLGVVALLLAFLPVLGVPIGAIGLVLGILGCLVTLLVRGTSLRWSLAGAAVSSLAVGMNLAIYYAPSGYLPQPRVPPTWQPVPDRPRVSPPAIRAAKLPRLVSAHDLQHLYSTHGPRLFRRGVAGCNFFSKPSIRLRCSGEGWSASFSLRVPH